MRITNQLFINNAKTVHKQLRLTVYKQCVCVLLRALPLTAAQINIQEDMYKPGLTLVIIILLGTCIST